MSQSKRYTVMIVDDTPENISILDGILSPIYDVLVATNGVDALELIDKIDTKPDLILLDIMMPKMDGYQVCELLKKDINYRKIPVIFITALSTDLNQDKGFRMGAVDYITKPFSSLVVMARIRTHLMLYDQARALEVLVEERTADLKGLSLEIIHLLGRTAEFKDNETGLHVIRMSHYCRMLAEAAGLTPREVEIVFQAAPMHDIGKIGIPDNVLLKTDKLTPEEWNLMKKHAEFGATIIGKQKSDLLKMAYTVALNHHEKWDGTGYPAGLKGTDIPIEARILAICDVFDALTSKRVYKKAWSLGDAFDYIKSKAGTQFDPKLVEVFLNIKNDIIEFHSKHKDRD